MVREIDESYWKDYYHTHNERLFEDLVNLYYAEQALFENPKVQAAGRERILAFFISSNQDVHIELVPHVIISESGVTATELDCIIHPQKDMPDFLLGPVKKGDEVIIRMAAIYHMNAGLISQARIYWGRHTD